ncbi:hypothetical protein NHF46_12740 [Arthrobacter alpinus]|nr:hypothetical protein [Arthrobacter alpinus]
MRTIFGMGKDPRLFERRCAALRCDPRVQGPFNGVAIEGWKSSLFSVEALRFFEPPPPACCWPVRSTVG